MNFVKKNWLHITESEWPTYRLNCRFKLSFRTQFKGVATLILAVITNEDCYELIKTSCSFQKIKKQFTIYSKNKSKVPAEQLKGFGKNEC